MFHIVLNQPQIPPNTGNVIRLCANTGARLHLVEPLGFDLDDTKLRRAGLDYHDLARVQVHESWPRLRTELVGANWYAFSAHGTGLYSQPAYGDGDVLVFGTERTGLTDEALADFPDDRILRLPMKPESRSLNLSNAVSIVLYEAWRQRGFTGSADHASEPS